MLDQVLEFFNIKPDYDLNIMKNNQSLFDITAHVLKGLEKILDKYKPDLIFVQGDTTTTFVGALAGFYKKIKVAHIEAGLRSHNKYCPFPEEINRVLVGHLADYHFAPTERARENLIKEGIEGNIFVVGNSVIDALFLGLDIIKQKGEEEYYDYFNFIDFSKKIILVTGHRRESFGEPFENICNALKEIVENYKDVEIVYPVHLNPNVREPVNRILNGINNIHLIEPQSYPYLIWLMSKSYMILTDSGGIQEEAPSLGKPVLVMREVTERIEGIEAGTAKLVGTNKDKIISEVVRLLTDKDEHNKMAKAINPYGDGKASKRILEIIKNRYGGGKYD
jgi:UDP-N-acetylglucosamine 2-epimerase (non-hydrolysing)